MSTLAEDIRVLYESLGSKKPMGLSAADTKKPHFFLLRTFKGENDLLIIFNTKRCAYQCYFCQLPAKSSKTWISGRDIIEQFKYVIYEVKDALSILDRVTLSNEGSVLDQGTFPSDALLEIADCVHQLRRVRTLVLETRLEYVESKFLQELKRVAMRVSLNILTGFETHDPDIRDNILGKRESLAEFEKGLDQVAASNAYLTAYVLYKPSYEMTDEEAYEEAQKSIDYLARECNGRGIPFSIRLNPMYSADGSRWQKKVANFPQFKPPRLTDVMRLAQKNAERGISIYIGLSTEGLDDGSTYRSRNDFSPELIRPIKIMNENNDSPVKSF